MTIILFSLGDKVFALACILAALFIRKPDKSPSSVIIKELLEFPPDIPALILNSGIPEVSIFGCSVKNFFLFKISIIAIVALKASVAEGQTIIISSPCFL